MKLDKTVMVSALPLALHAQKAKPVVVVGDDLDSAMPADLRSFLVGLRLLEGVPFANLVADTELLPRESIRWFYLDRRWTDALVQGSLSVGTVNSDDRTHLSAQYDAIRAELDQEERNRRRAKDSARFAGSVDAVSGFLLRSDAVAGWPGLHVRAFTVDPEEADDARYQEDDARRMRLLRLERLAPAVLLCLFDGVPSVVHLEEPRQGVQFGVDQKGEGANEKLILRPRNPATFDYLPNKEVTVPFRSGTGTSGVVDIQRLSTDLRAQVGLAHPMTSADYATQLIRFPWRQVWGDPEGHVVADVFTVQIAYAALAPLFTVQP